MKTIDCRNMACPLPVVTVKRALEEAGGAGVMVMLDNGAPRENVGRFAANRGYVVSEEPVDGGWLLTIGGGTVASAGMATETVTGQRVMLVASDRMGEGPEDLGRLLMKNFIITLLEMEVLPDRIFFINTGVFLTTEGSELLEALDALGNRGVEVLSCGACLDFFHRKELLRAGTVTNMLTIAEGMLKAGLVIRP